MTHHLIFEGAELSGKSWVMSQIYSFLESKYHQNDNILDGCQWFNCDVGVFGTDRGKRVIKNYVNIFQELQDKNIIVEKLYLADQVYNRLYNKKKISYRRVERKIKKLDFRIILLTFPENIDILEKRLADRINLYPHYKRIAKSAEFYIKQQRLYLKKIKKSKIPYIAIEIAWFPDGTVVPKILEWLGEK